MRDEVMRDLSDSSYDFVREVWPAIKTKLHDGILKPVEAIASEELQHDLDRLAGIDAWHIRDDRGLMRGIASRVQWLEPTEKLWRSFTIRMKRPNESRTEFEKRCEAIDRIDEGWLLPHLTIQGYLTKPRRTGYLLTAGVVRTRDLYAYARQHITGRRWLRNPEDGVLFTAWFWDELETAGIQVGIVNGDAPTPTFDEVVAEQGEIEGLEIWTTGGPTDWDDVATRRPPDWEPVA